MQFAEASRFSPARRTPSMSTTKTCSDTAPRDEQFMSASALLLGASAALRAASLNLCTDEYLLLLARPAEIVGVSYLSQDPLESPLWRVAHQYEGNRGSIEDVIPLKPTLLLTMGGGGRSTALLAKRLHARALDVPYASSLDDVERNLRLVASALNENQRAAPW